MHLILDTEIKSSLLTTAVALVIVLKLVTAHNYWVMLGINALRKLEVEGVATIDRASHTNAKGCA
jgi:hypothetical protein